ncbi:hypothetical protein Tco_0038230 [Tanacetum coccineum]
MQSYLLRTPTNFAQDFDPRCYSEKENSLPYVSKPNFVDDSPNVFTPPPQPPMYSCEFCGNDARYGHYLRENLVLIPSESEGIPDSVCDVPLCNNPTPLEAFKEHSETVIDFNDDSTSSDDDSPYGEDIDYVDASPPDAEIVSLEVVENVIPEVGGIDTNILLTIKDDIIREKLLNVNLLIANIDALKDNPTPSSDFMTKSSSTSLNLFLEETNTFANSLPESETFCFDLEENSRTGKYLPTLDYSFPIMKLSISMTIMLKKRVVAVPPTHS